MERRDSRRSGGTAEGEAFVGGVAVVTVVTVVVAGVTGISNARRRKA